MKEKQITVLMVEPGKNPHLTTLDNDLDSLQKAVSIGASYQGLIEIFGVDNDTCILCNEEAKLIGLEPNSHFYNDILCGVFYVCGESDDGELTFLSPAMQDHSVPASSVKQNRLFGHPQLAVKYGSKEFREAKVKVPRKRKKPRKRSVFKTFRGSFDEPVVEISGIEPLTSLCHMEYDYFGLQLNVHIYYIVVYSSFVLGCPMFSFAKKTR